MPPLPGMGRALRAESDLGPALMSVTVPRSLSLCESTHPRQGSGRAASLAPRSSLHEHDGSTPTGPQALGMLDEPPAPFWLVNTFAIWVDSHCCFLSPLLKGCIPRNYNPEDDLPRDFDQHRATYYADLNLPLSADEFIASLKAQLTTALASFERFMAKKPSDVAIGTKRGKGWITLSPLPKQPEPKHLPRLKTEILRRWGVLGLLDMLKESAMLTGCLDCFQSTGSREAIDPELLHKRLLLCMYGMGTNMGLKRMAGVDPNITAEDLRYTRRRYLHKEHMRAAIAQVVNALLRARLESIWGAATSTCASDSKRFYAVDQNLLTQWHARYRAPGVLVYWHVERRSVCIYSQLKSCTSSVKILYFFRSGSDAGGSAAPLYRHDHQAPDDRFAWTK